MHIARQDGWSGVNLARDGGAAPMKFHNYLIIKNIVLNASNAQQRDKNQNRAGNARSTHTYHQSYPQLHARTLQVSAC
jgi:hypothetical protein